MEHCQGCLTFTVKEAGERLGLSRGLMYLAIRTGEIPSLRIGRRILIPRTALESMLQSPSVKKPPNIDGSAAE